MLRMQVPCRRRVTKIQREVSLFAAGFVLERGQPKNASLGKFCSESGRCMRIIILLCYFSFLFRRWTWAFDHTKAAPLQECPKISRTGRGILAAAGISHTGRGLALWSGATGTLCLVINFREVRGDTVRNIVSRDKFPRGSYKYRYGFTLQIFSCRVWAVSEEGERLVL